MKQLVEKLKQFNTVVVIGPQRSGTRIGAKVLAHELGYKYVDELAFDCEDVAQFIDVQEEPWNKVIHAPALTHMATRYPEYAAWVMMIRDIEDVLASQKSMGWAWDEYEQVKYQAKYETSAATKYIWWFNNKNRITNAFELLYKDLEGHSLFVPKERRKDFKWNQTEEE